jgi:hypothetical protein
MKISFYIYSWYDRKLPKLADSGRINPAQKAAQFCRDVSEDILGKISGQALESTGDKQLPSWQSWDLSRVGSVEPQMLDKNG